MSEETERWTECHCPRGEYAQPDPRCPVHNHLDGDPTE